MRRKACTGPKTRSDVLCTGPARSGTFDKSMAFPVRCDSRLWNVYIRVHLYIYKCACGCVCYGQKSKTHKTPLVKAREIWEALNFKSDETLRPRIRRRSRLVWWSYHKFSIYFSKLFNLERSSDEAVENRQELFGRFFFFLLYSSL